MNNSQKRGHNRKRQYEPVPYQLSNQALLEKDKASAPAHRLFPEAAVLHTRNRIVHPAQFIVAGTGPEIDLFTVGKQVWLEPDKSSGRIGVTVIKSRKSAPRAKRYVLLETMNSTSLVHLEGKEVSVYDGPASPESLGTIHTGGGESNTGGGQDHSGQANCYGVALLVQARAKGLPSEIRVVSQAAAFEQDAGLGTATIAVLDSGIRFTDSVPAAVSSSHVGWDFVTDEPEGKPFPADDHLGLHGTKISSIIRQSAPEVGILPVKISNRNGSLTLYDALCGLEYARTHGAKVINASWSFSAQADDNNDQEDFPLLLQAMQDLEASGVVVVAAAGNKSQYENPDGAIGEQGAPKIYPACYSAVQDNVITVTTVAQMENSKFTAVENYSPEYVDTGALANAPGAAGQFVIPGFAGSYDGTSFATPYVAAKIARLLSKSPGYLGKRSLLRQLPGFMKQTELAYAIRDGGSYVAV